MYFSAQNLPHSPRAMGRLGGKTSGAHLMQPLFIAGLTSELGHTAQRLVQLNFWNLERWRDSTTFLDSLL